MIFFTIPQRLGDCAEHNGRRETDPDYFTGSFNFDILINFYRNNLVRALFSYKIYLHNNKCYFMKIIM